MQTLAVNLRWICVLIAWAATVNEPCALEILSTQTRGNLNAVTVTFSVPVSESTATNPANYAINNGVMVSNVTLIEAAKVRLNTSLIPEGRVYTVTVSNVQDTASPPNIIAPPYTTVPSPIKTCSPMKTRPSARWCSPGRNCALR